MSVEFKLPELGENITSGDVVSVLVHEGDVIAANDGVIELETDKAVVEIPCPQAGKIVKIHVSKGKTIKVGEAVLSIEAEEAGGQPAAAARGETKSTKPPTAAGEPPYAAPTHATPAAKENRPEPAKPQTAIARRAGSTPAGTRVGRRSFAGSGQRQRRADYDRRCPRGRDDATTSRRARPGLAKRQAAEVPAAAGRVRARTPTVRSAASGCRRFAAPSPRRWSSRPARFPT